MQKGAAKVDGRGRGGQWQEEDLGADGWHGDDGETNDDDSPALIGAEATFYGAVAARLTYLAPDRPILGERGGSSNVRAQAIAHEDDSKVRQVLQG